MAKEIFITGMEGMAGSHLARESLEQGFTVVGTCYPGAATSNIKDLLQDGRVVVHEVDLRNGSDVANLVASITKPDYVIHLAGKANNSKSWGDDTLEGNVAMTHHLLEKLTKHDVKPKIVLASTVNVYGSQTDETGFSEERALNPDTPYALSKQVQEALVLMYSERYGIPAVIARPSQHTGSGRASGFVEYEIGEQIIRIEKGEQPAKIEVRNAMAEVSLLDVRDVVIAYLLLVQKGKNREVYNISPGYEFSIRVLAKMMLASSQIPNGYEDIEIVSTGNEVTSNARYSNKKIVALGWQQKYDPQKTMEDFLVWMRNK